ncbi:MAG: hypothetical protein ACI8RZ_004254 [Myxococcota bacterium]|jgi:hypothetical protein
MHRNLPRNVSVAQDPDGALGAWTCREPVAVAIPDITRPLDCVPALVALRSRLLGGMTVSIGLGLHRRMTDAELAPLSGFAPIQHDPDDAVPTITVMGIPGAVGRPVAEAAWSIGVGIAELHQYAGISGGHKAVAVGCGGRGTIAALHHRDRVCAPGVRLGQLEGNPFRAAIDGLGEAAGCRLCLLYVPSARRWLAGPPRAVVAHAAAMLDPWQTVPRCAPGALLRVPPAKAASLYQASRAATYLALSPNPPIVLGGTLLLEAACPEGLGAEAGFVAAMRAHSPPWQGLLTGPPPMGAGAQRAVMFALMAQRFRLRVTGCSSAAALREVGIDATEEPAALPPGWLDVPEPFHRLPQVSA